MPLSNTSHLLGLLYKLTRQLAVRRPDELDGVTPGRMFDQGADATEFVVGVGENSEESHPQAALEPCRSCKN